MLSTLRSLLGNPAGAQDYEQQEQSRPSKKRNITDHGQFDEEEIRAMLYDDSKSMIYIRHGQQLKADINVILGQFNGEIDTIQVYIPHADNEKTFECITELGMNSTLVDSFIGWYREAGLPLGPLMDNSLLEDIVIQRIKPNGVIVNHNLGSLIKASMLIRFTVNNRATGANLLRINNRLDLTSDIFNDTLGRAIKHYTEQVLQLPRGRFEIKTFTKTSCFTIIHMIHRITGRDKSLIVILGYARAWGTTDVDVWDNVWMVHMDKGSSDALRWANHPSWRHQPKRDLSDWKERENNRDARPDFIDYSKKPTQQGGRSSGLQA